MLDSMLLSNTEVDYVKGLIQAHCGVVVDGSLDVRLRHTLDQWAAAHPEGLVVQLKGTGGDAILQQLVEALVNSETSFFREEPHFAALVEKVLPDVLGRAEPAGTVTLWSAGCATGQEPYSLAMTLLERFGPEAATRFRIIATDLSRRCLDRAREGVYSALEVSRGLSAERLERHFRRRGMDWQVCELVRRMISFPELNLVRDAWGLPPVDVAFLRNVMIYFDMDTRRAVLERMRRQLRPGGYLFLGSVETTYGVDDALERVDCGATFCYRRPEGR